MSRVSRSAPMLFMAVAGFAGGWLASHAFEQAVVSVVLPIRLDQADLAGGAFRRFESVQRQHQESGRSWATMDAEIFLSPDRKFDAGVYRSDPVRLEIAQDYGVHEFMYFLEGGVILTSADGSRLEIAAGEGVVIPADWRGIWHSPAGYRKIYVIYSPDGPIVP